MRTIGLLGGLSWESTATYYALLNRGAAARHGPLRQAPILLHSFDFADVAARQAAGEWDALGEQLAAAARGLAGAGAEVLGICANTMHLVADEVAAGVPGVELVHVVGAAAAAAHALGASTVGLLGTAYTMEHPFYADGLRAEGLEVTVPGPEDRAALHRVIYDELTRGIVTPGARRLLLDIAGRCAQAGADAVLLACTELQLLVEPGDPDAPIPLVDTTAEHCTALLDAAERPAP